MRQIQSSLQLVLADHIDQADQTMKGIDGISMPPTVDAARWLTWGVIRSRESRPTEALKALEKAESLNADLPALHTVRARALNQLGRYQEAAAEARKYLDELGADAHAYTQLGDGLAALKRNGEAAEAYRKGLDDIPDSELNLVGLRRVLQAGHKAELAERLARCEDPYVAFTVVAADAARRSDLETLEAVTNVIRKSHADDTLLEYYDAMVKHLHHENREAAAMFLHNYSRATQKDRPVVAREYVLSMLDAAEPIEAYRQAPDPQASFRQIASNLYGKKDWATLRQLIDLRQHGAADDPWPAYYLGLIHEQSGKDADAAAAYEQAYRAAAQQQDKAVFRARLIPAACRADLGMALYQKFGPTLFDPLAEQYARWHWAKHLGPLIDAHRKASPDDAGLPYWEAKLQYLRGKYADAAGILQDQRGRIEEGKKGYDARVSDLLVRCLSRCGQSDAAMAEAQSTAGPGGVSPLYVAIIEANRANVAGADAAMARLMSDSDDEPYTLAGVYADPDLGHALRSPAFAHWRESHPDPSATTQPASTQPR